MYLTDVVKWKTSEKLTLNSEGQVTEAPLVPGTITIIVPSTEETKPAEDQKNPSTGANDVVAAAVALMAVSALGMAVLARKK